MDILFAIGALLFPLVVVGGVIVGIVMVMRRAPAGEQAPGIGSTRRLFLYGLAFVALMVGAIGASVLVSGLIEITTGGALISDDPTSAAFGIASTTVGLGVWALLTWAGRRSLVQYPAEAGTFGRKLYAYAVLGVSGAVAATFLVEAIAYVLNPTDIDRTLLGTAPVWGLVWAWHWVTEQAEGQPSPIAQSVRRLYVYGTSVYALIMLATGAGLLLSTLLGAAYAAVVGSETVIHDSLGLWSTGTRSAIALAAVGGIWWWFHWHYTARHDQESDLRRIVVNVLGLLGGSLSLVVALSTGLFIVLVWLIDRPSETSAAMHFDVIPDALAAAFVSAGVWGYHASLAFAEAPVGPGGRRAAIRVYRYVSALVGLGTLWSGLIMILAVAIGLVTSPDDVLVVTSGSRTPLVSALTLMAVGAPLWTWHWLRVQALVQAESDESRTLARRAYLFGVVGMAVLVMLLALSTGLFMVLEALLSGDLSADTFHNARWAFAPTLVSAVVGAYHWPIIREDRAMAPEEPSGAPERTPKQVTAAAPAGAEAIVNAIGERTGGHVVIWQRRDAVRSPELTAQQIDEIAERVQAAPGERVLLVLDDNGVQVIPL